MFFFSFRNEIASFSRTKKKMKDVTHSAKVVILMVFKLFWIAAIRLNPCTISIKTDITSIKPIKNAVTAKIFK